MKIARIAVAPALALAIAVGGFAADASANAKGDTAVGCAYGVAEGPAVVITGGEISNVTNIDISASAGSAVADASGGNMNIGTSGGGGLGASTSNVGGGGAANAAANGGAISLGDINSGANVGNSIVVGDTANCAEAAAPATEQTWEMAPAEAPAMVVALPATGAGGFDAGLFSALAAAGAAGAAGLGLRRRG